MSCTAGPFCFECDKRKSCYIFIKDLERQGYDDDFIENLKNVETYKPKNKE